MQQPAGQPGAPSSPSSPPLVAAPSSISYTAPPRGSTFFVGRTAAQSRLPQVGGALRGPRPLPTTPARSTVAVSSDPLAPSPSPRPYAPSAPAIPTSIIPLPSSSGILVHGGFWDLLAATGSRFYSPSRLEMGVVNGGTSPSAAAGAAPNPFAREMAAEVAARRAGPAGRAVRQKKRVSVDMISRPRDFACVCFHSPSVLARRQTLTFTSCTGTRSTPRMPIKRRRFSVGGRETARAKSAVRPSLLLGGRSRATVLAHRFQELMM